MPRVLLLHSMLGLRPAVLDLAERLRSAGHEVKAPDLMEGAVFSGLGEAQAFMTGYGYQKVFAAAAAAAREFGPGAVYAGFSLGAACALGAAARMPGARGCVAAAGAATLEELRASAWPAGLPLQVHFSVADPGYDRARVAAIGAAATASGSVFELFEYASGGHLFADPGLPDYDAASARLFQERLMAFVGRPALS